MSFNSDPVKQAQEVIVSRKVNKDSHSPLNFNSNNCFSGCVIKGSRLIIRLIFSKINKSIGLQYHIPRSTLLTIYKTFLRPHLDYDAIIYEKAHNSSFHQKIESV